MVASMKEPFSGKAGFQISNTVRCFWHTWPARSPDFVVQDCVIWGYVIIEAWAGRPTNINYLKQRIHEGINGIPK